MSLSELFESNKWKSIINYCYSWGASLVLMGALFKLQHWQGSGLMLTIGMLTEVVIFFISGFEKPMEQPKWNEIIPDLKENLSGKGSNGALGELLSSAELPSELISSVRKGFTDLSNAAHGIAEISNATLATEVYVKNLNSASEAMISFSEENNKAGKNLSGSVDKLTSSYTQVSGEIKKSGASLATALQDAQKEILGGSDQIFSDLEGIKKGSKDYGLELEKLNKNMSAINAVYELQLKGSNDSIEVSKKFYNDLHKMNSLIVDTVSETEKYREQAAKLNENLKALNTVYGNMLGAMNFTNIK